MTYVAQRLAEIGRNPPPKRYPHIGRATREAIKREYFTPCTCCGLRPSMADLARKYDMTPTTVWRIVNRETQRIGRKVKRALSSAIEEARHDGP